MKKDATYWKEQARIYYCSLSHIKHAYRGEKNSYAYTEAEKALKTEPLIEERSEGK